VSTHRPRPRLRELREARGWTQADVAERLIQLAWIRHREQIGVNANMIAKWERGAKGISVRYRRLLAELLRVTIDQLGLGDTAPTTAPAAPDSLAAVADAAAELLSQLGAPGRRLGPQLLATLTDETPDRRSILTMLDPGSHAEPPTTDASAAELDALAEGYEAAYPTMAPAALLTAAAAHVQMVTDALGHDLPTGRRQQLLRNRARVAILAGRLATEKLADHHGARAYYSQATDDAAELNDDLLHAITIGHAAQLAITTGQPAAALRHLRGLTVAEPNIASWLANLEASVHAEQSGRTVSRLPVEAA
jgi:transcriptional regulator with XRE-family HTH domain